MPDAIKIIIKDKFTNKLIALKLKEDTSLARVIDVLKKRYDHLQNKEISLVLRGEELDLGLTLQNLVDQKNYTEKERIEIADSQPAPAPAAVVSLPETQEEPNFVHMMSQGKDQFDQAILEILVRRRVLLRETAEAALSTARQTQRSLITTLIEEAYLAEKDILTNVSRFLEIPSIDLEGVKIGPEVLEIIPQQQAEYYCIVPIRREEEAFWVAMTNPFDAKKLHDLRMLTGQNIEATMSTEPAIRAKIKAIYQQKLVIPEAMPVEPEEGSLPDDLFSAPADGRKGPLVIKDGKKIEDSKDIAPEEYDAPTLWADKSEEILKPVDLEEEAPQPASQKNGQDDIWEAPTVHDNKGKKTAAVPTPQPAEEEMGGMEISPNEEGKEITPVEASWDEASMGGAIPIYAGLTPDEIPQAIEISPDANEDKLADQVIAASDLMKTERMEMSRKGLSNAMDPKMELPKDIGVTPEELELENSIRQEKLVEAEQIPQSIPFEDEQVKAEQSEAPGEVMPPLDLSLPEEHKEEPIAGDMQGFDLSHSENEEPKQPEASEENLPGEEPEKPLQEILRSAAQPVSSSDFQKTVPKDFVAPPANEQITRDMAQQPEPEPAIAPEPEPAIAPEPEPVGAPEKEERLAEETPAPEPKSTHVPTSPIDSVELPVTTSESLEVAKSKAEQLLELQERLASKLEDASTKAQNILATHTALSEEATRLRTGKTAESAASPLEAAKPSLQKIARQVAVRFFRRMHPLQTLPLSVILSYLKQDVPAGKGIAQVQGKPVEVRKDNPWVKVVPSIPGCLTVPHDAVVDVTPPNAEVKFWITPLGEGRINEAQVEIWYQNKCLQKIPVAISVVRQWPAKLAVACSVAMPVLSFLYEVYGGLWLQRLPENMQNLLGQLPRLAEPLGGMLNLGLAAGAGFLVLAMILALFRKTKRAKPVSATIDYEH